MNNQANANAAIQVAAQIFASVSGPTGLNVGSLNQNQVDAAQLAVWTALYDTSISGGVVTQTGNTRFTVNTALGSGAGSVGAYLTQYLTAADVAVDGGANLTGQLLIPDLTGNPTEPGQELFYTPVPEPSTVIAGALVLLPFGASTVRILRRKNGTA